MDKEIKAIFAISDAKYQTKHRFSVVLGKKNDETLEKEIEEKFAKCIKDNRINMIFDGSIQEEFECEKIESPFFYGSNDYLEINKELKEIKYYSKENDKILKELKKKDVVYEDMHGVLWEKIYDNKS